MPHDCIKKLCGKPIKNGACLMCGVTCDCLVCGDWRALNGHRPALTWLQRVVYARQEMSA